MQLPIHTTTTRTWKEIKAHHGVAACVGALVLAAFAAVGGWQAVGSGGPGVASVTPRSVVAVPASPREPNATYYLVASQTQAGFVIQGEEDAARMRAAEDDFGPRDDVEVFVANDGASLNLAMQDIRDLNAIRFQIGLPEIKLVDLRDPVQ
jgi:hypothetical protein